MLAIPDCVGTGVDDEAVVVCPASVGVDCVVDGASVVVLVAESVVVVVTEAENVVEIEESTNVELESEVVVAETLAGSGTTVPFVMTVVVP